MAKECIVVEATTNSSTKPLLPSRVSYTRSLSYVVRSSGASGPASSGCVSTSPT
ncbi:hypothetical protein BHM03_00047130 [Ensete ventricosum]|nr:hypothetical protein BHM03_00047130 [Ensete ventricosum]